MENLIANKDFPPTFTYAQKFLICLTPHKFYNDSFGYFILYSYVWIGPFSLEILSPLPYPLPPIWGSRWTDAIQN